MTALAQGDRQSKTAGQKDERRIPTGWSQPEVKYSVIPVKSCPIHNSVYCFISSPKKIRLQFFYQRSGWLETGPSGWSLPQMNFVNLLKVITALCFVL